MSEDFRPAYPYGVVSLNVGLFTNIWVPLPPFVEEDEEGTFSRQMTIGEMVAWLVEQLGGDEYAEAQMKRRVVDSLLGDTVAAPSAAPQGDGRAAPAQRRSRNAQAGTGLFCPQHRKVELVETKKEWQEYTDEGLPDKFFCPGRENGTGENHQVYRREAEGAGQPVSGGSEYDEDPRDSRQGVGAAPQEDVPVDDAPQPF
jgi:hypothetical protein